MKRVIFLIFLASLLTACGTKTEQSQVQGSVSENSVTDTQTADTTENIPEQENSVSFQVDPELEEGQWKILGEDEIKKLSEKC